MRVILLCLAAGCEFQHGVAPDQTSSDGSVSSEDATETPSEPLPLVLHPDADTWLRQQFPDEIHGSDVDLRTGSGSTTARANRLLLRFNLESIPTTCEITEAQLYLYFFQEDFVNVSTTLDAHRVTTSWSQEAASWKEHSAGTDWQTAGGDLAATNDASTVVAAMTFGWITWDLTAVTLRWRTGSDPNHGIALTEPDDNSGNGGRKLFFSMQSSTTTDDRRPYLRVACR